MRKITALAASLLIVSICTASTFSTASAQSINKRGKQGAHGAAAREEEAIEAPINTNKFPGVGSVDAWKTSVPEYRSGIEKMKERKWDDAIAHFRASIALYEYQPQAWLHIGHCIEKKDGLITDAEAAYRHCIKLDAQSWGGWKALGNVLYQQKKYDEARQSISNAMNLSPPPKQREAMGKMIQMIDAGMANSNTQQMNTGSD